MSKSTSTHTPTLYTDAQITVATQITKLLLIRKEHDALAMFTSILIKASTDAQYREYFINYLNVTLSFTYLRDNLCAPVKSDRSSAEFYFAWVEINSCLYAIKANQQQNLLNTIIKNKAINR